MDKEDNVQKFWELMEQSVLVQASVTLILVCAYAYMVATGQEVPDGLGLTLGTVLGFWFGTKTQQLAARKVQ